jgi:hypothetical protein
MISRNRLASLYEEWRLLSESEGDAIRSLAWQRVEHCQTAKAQLREQIIRVIESTTPVNNSAEEIRRQFRPVLEHLIELERRNSEWLQLERERLEHEQADLSRGAQAVQRMRGTYGAGVHARP